MHRSTENPSTLLDILWYEKEDGHITGREYIHSVTDIGELRSRRLFMAHSRALSLVQGFLKCILNSSTLPMSICSGWQRARYLHTDDRMTEKELSHQHDIKHSLHGV
jgi:hypothetical protein